MQNHVNFYNKIKPMKSIIFGMLMALFVLPTAFAGDDVISPIAVGTELPDENSLVKDISGNDLNIIDLAGENGLLLLFSCNTCPYVIAWEDRYPEISKICAENEIGFVVLNPNEAKREGADSYTAMQTKAEETGYDFYYAVDENHKWADALGATKTPDVFLFNSDLKLAYQGAIDDNMKVASEVKEAFLKNAVSKMIAGEEINPATTKAIGCSIKRIAQ